MVEADSQSPNIFIYLFQLSHEKEVAITSGIDAEETALFSNSTETGSSLIRQETKMKNLGNWPNQIAILFITKPWLKPILFGTQLKAGIKKHWRRLHSCMLQHTTRLSEYELRGSNRFNPKKAIMFMSLKRKELQFSKTFFLLPSAMLYSSLCYETVMNTASFFREKEY